MPFEKFKYIMSNRYNVYQRNKEWPYILGAHYELMKERQAMEEPVVGPATLAE